MIRSLYSGVTGMTNHQIKMDVIGNNIANINTYGFKKGRVVFQDLFSQSIRNAYGPSPDAVNSRLAGQNPVQVGLGSQIGSIDTLHTQGTLQITNKKTDVALQGNGFFVLQNQNARPYYTRVGTLDIDATGHISQTQTGYRVLGWRSKWNGQEFSVDEKDAHANNAGPINLNDIMNLDPQKGLTEDLVPGMKLPAQATTFIEYSCNLDASADPNTTHITSITVYDSLGRQYPLSAEFKNRGYFDGTNIQPSYDPLDPAASADENKDYHGIVWSLTPFLPKDSEVTAGSMVNDNPSQVFYPLGVAPGINAPDPGGGTTINTEPHDPAFYDTARQSDTSFAETSENIELLGQGRTDVEDPTNQYAHFHPVLIFDETTGRMNKAATAVANGLFRTTSDYYSALQNDANTPYFPQIEFTPSDNQGDTEGNAKTISINLDLENITHYQGEFTTSAKAQNGYTFGSLESLDIDADGRLLGLYSNGYRAVLAQLALATFNNPGGLNKEGSSLYTSTANSGEALVGRARTSGLGTVASGALENSNVDLSSEFTDIIITQRGYQANSRVITVSNQMLEELVNLVR